MLLITKSALEGLSASRWIGMGRVERDLNGESPSLLSDRLSYKKGGDLLSRLRSTIGAGGLNFSVRNGKRWNTSAIATLTLLVEHLRYTLSAVVFDGGGATLIHSGYS